jgi:chloramphenicol 3-O-phosphotransferase
VNRLEWPPRNFLRNSLDGTGKLSVVTDQRVLVLNGPAGIGKSTVARALAARTANGAWIEGDALKAFVVTRDRHGPRGLSYRVAGAAAGVYLDAGFELVVFDFVFHDADMVDQFARTLPAKADLHVVTLWADLATVTARERGRPGREPLREMVAVHWRRVRDKLFELGAVVVADGPVDDVVLGVERAVDGRVGAYPRPERG